MSLNNNSQLAKSLCIQLLRVSGIRGPAPAETHDAVTCYLNTATINFVFP